NGLGSQESRDTSDSAAVLTANRGREGLVHLRWRAPNAPGTANAMDVREAYWWDLRGGNFAVTAALEVTSVKGTLNHLVVTIPESVEVVGVDATSASSSSHGSVVVGDWRVVDEKSGRSLHVNLSGSVDRPVLLRLSLVPRLRVAPGNVSLPLPAPAAG